MTQLYETGSRATANRIKAAEHSYLQAIKCSLSSCSSSSRTQPIYSLPTYSMYFLIEASIIAYQARRKTSC